MVRNIPRSLEKDSMCVIPLINNNLVRRWMGAVGEGGAHSCAGVPVMQSFYMAYTRNGCSPGKLTSHPLIREKYQSFGRAEEKVLQREITPTARLHVFIAWGITPDEQVALESYYDSWTYFPEPGDIETVNPFLNVICLPR